VNAWAAVWRKEFEREKTNMAGRENFLSIAGLQSLSLVEEESTVEAEREISEENRRREPRDAGYGLFRALYDGKFTTANTSLLRMLACASLNDLKAMNLGRDTFRYQEYYEKLAAACREQGLVQSAEAEWRRKDGGLISVRVHLRRCSLPGRGEGLEGIVEDVTEARARERQAQQAQKFESIGQLAGGIAHDFNNVVGAILGWAELGYEQSREHAAIAERFTRIRVQAERAAALTQELLAFARRQPRQGQAIDLNALTTNFAERLEKLSGQAIEVRVIPRMVEKIQGDPGQLEQVLGNLCLNAREAMENGGGQLTIETESAELDGSYCRLHPGVATGRYAVLSVSDTGIGMNEETRERAFEPFFTTKERRAGGGMGLATVYGIVKQHGGFVEVFSEPGQGSSFRAYFPCVAATEAAESVSDARARLCGAELNGTETILLAEDDDSIREMLRQTLMRLGYRVLAAADGQHALILCEQDAPALAVLDVVMPRLGGAETAEKILQRFPNTLILFTSGYAERSKALEAQIPASHYLQKPYSPTTLSRAIRNLLSGGEAGAVVRY
jgi:two-component system, cell cycle sensor histidine kinase and response regulator CckA